MSIVKRYKSVNEVREACEVGAAPFPLVGVGRCDSHECQTFGSLYVIAALGERGGVYCAPCATENAAALSDF